MDSEDSMWRRLSPVLWSVALAVVVVSTTADLISASADGWSAWDWVRAAALTGLVLSIGGRIVLRVAARRPAAVDRDSVDLGLVRVARERDGRVAAVREVRRQDPALSLVEATRVVDAL